MEHKVERLPRLVLCPVARKRRRKAAAREDEFTRQYNVMLRALQRIKNFGYGHQGGPDIAKKALESVMKGWGEYGD